MFRVQRRRVAQGRTRLSCPIPGDQSSPRRQSRDPFGGPPGPPEALRRATRKGREGDYTSENILRALIVQHIEGLPFREAVIRIGSDPFLQDFLRMRKKAGDGLHLSGQVLPGHPAGDLEAGQRTAGPVRRCGRRAVNTERDPHRHDGGGVEHPLPHRCVAAVGHLAGGVAAVEAGAGDRPGKCAAPLPRPQDQAAVPVHHPLHAQQVGVSPAEGESGASAR